jgi:hypothetical protein
MIRMMPRPVTPWLIACLSLIPAVASSDCLTDFLDRIDGQPYETQRAEVDALGARDLKCLFQASRDQTFEDPVDYFVPEENRRERRVSVFHGKNSLPAFSFFEKHFFVSKAGVLLGYNDSFAGRLLRSPGFFVGRYAPFGPLVLDYRIDIHEEITTREFRKWRGRSVWFLKSNEGDPLFGGLIDVLRPITEDVAIGQALRKRPSGWRHETYFILLRTP